MRYVICIKIIYPQTCQLTLCFSNMQKAFRAFKQLNILLEMTRNVYVLSAYHCFFFSILHNKVSRDGSGRMVAVAPKGLEFNLQLPQYIMIFSSPAD